MIKFIYVGDTIKYDEYQGVILYNPDYRQYGVALDYSMWYGTDKYNIDSYGKFISIPMDNGAKMEIEKISGLKPTYFFLTILKY